MAKNLLDLLGDPEAMAFADPVGQDTRRKPANRDVLNALLAGFGDLAYDVAGGPVDLSSGLMAALGADIGKTAGGSDWFKDLATQYGIRPPESSDPTLRNVRLGAEIASGGIDPYAVAGGIGRAGSAFGRKAGPYIADKIDNYMDSSGLRPAIYENTSKKGHRAGTRYTTEDVGGIAPKKDFNIEDREGASMLLMPWDNSSRNRRVLSVSDEPVTTQEVTHGGQMFARDMSHIDAKIGGSSNKDISGRIRDRVTEARKENLAAGGTGEVDQSVMTMGSFGEDFSVQPLDVMMDNFILPKLTKAKAVEIDDAMAGHKYLAKKPPFSGIATPIGQAQLKGFDGGDYRKALMDIMRSQPNEKFFGYNRADLYNAISDPDLIGIPAGFGMNTVITHGKDPVTLSRSNNRTYDTDFSGTYLGTGGNMPAEVFMPDAINNLRYTFDAENKVDRAFARSPILAGLARRKEGISQLITPEVVDRVKGFQELRKERGLLDAMLAFEDKYGMPEMTRPTAPKKKGKK